MKTERAWSVKDALDWTADYLGRRSVEHPRRSAEWLLSAATGLSRVELYVYFDRPLTPQERAVFRASIERRAAGEPLQYVTGEMPFRHLVLRVRPGVFIPRPETEVLVDVALEAFAGVEAPTVLDLCTGSGAVAVSLAQEVPAARVFATDVNPDAVELARENAERAGVLERVTVLEGNLFAPLPADLRGAMDAVFANPPYVPSGDLSDLPGEVAAHEPHSALDGGADGLDVARRILDGAREWLRPGGTLAIELDETRVTAAAGEAEVAGYRNVRVVKDLTGRDRVVGARTPSA